MDYGKRIKELREGAGLSQVELANKAHLTQPAISMIEASKRLPTFKTAEKIANALGIDLLDLLKEE